MQCKGEEGCFRRCGTQVLSLVKGHWKSRDHEHQQQGVFFDFEVGGHDGAYKGRSHVIVPFIGGKNDTLSARQQSYNDVHGWYPARIEQLFAHLWHWGLIRNIWLGGPNESHQSVRILLPFTQFCILRQVRYPPYGPWKHVPPHVWKSTEATVEDDTQDDVGEEDVGEEVDICALCIVPSKAHYDRMW